MSVDVAYVGESELADKKEETCAKHKTAFSDEMNCLTMYQFPQQQYLSGSKNKRDRL